MNTPAISVVMPVYNREGLVRHAIQSILDQTFSDWELIVVDDASTDKTASIVETYMRSDKRIKLLKNKKNMGISFTRNKGNKAAKGTIIVVQDSDDMSLPDRLQEIYDLFKGYPNTDVVYHWFYVRAMDIKFGLKAIHRELNKCGPYDTERALTVPYIPGQMAYRRKLALKHPYRNNIIFWDDWALIVDFTMAGAKFAELRKPLYEYVISDDSITTASMKSDLREQEMEKMKYFMRKEYKMKVQ